jgi:hypothetical protein
VTTPAKRNLHNATSLILSSSPLLSPWPRKILPCSFQQSTQRHEDGGDGTGEGREEGEEPQIVWEEDEDEEDLGFSSGDEEQDEDGRQIEWEEEDDQLESVFAEDEKSRWGGMSGSSSSGSSSLQDSQVSVQDWLQLVAAAVGEFWTEGQEEELSVEWSEISEEGSDSVAE